MDYGHDRQHSSWWTNVFLGPECVGRFEDALDARFCQCSMHGEPRPLDLHTFYVSALRAESRIEMTVALEIA